MLLLGGAMLMPTTVMAQSAGGGPEDDPMPEKHRSPAQNSYAYITYNGTTGIATVNFRTGVSDAEVIILQDGVEIDDLMVDATEGSQLTVCLPAYGSGEFTVQAKSGSTLLATYSITL